MENIGKQDLKLIREVVCTSRENLSVDSHLEGLEETRAPFGQLGLSRENPG